VAGTALYMAGSVDTLSRALLHNLACNKVLHERVIMLTVVIRDVPWVPDHERFEVKSLGLGFFRLIVYFGFMDRADVAKALELCEPHGLKLDPSEIWFLLSRSTVIPTRGGSMALWRERLFAAMARNARTAGDYFNIPANRVIELGTKIEI
jgi:KUP system potassium uptake protein